MKTLIFTIATNGYAEFLAEHIESQREYATKHGYEHIALIKTPPWGVSAANSSWLKIPMMLHYLRHGYDRVLSIDADARIMPNAPVLDAMETPGKSIYMAKESSGRFNAGVIMCLATPDAESYLRGIYRLADWPGAWLPAEDRNLYENGHVIYVARRFMHCIQTIDPRWNYTAFTELADPTDYFVLHGRDSWEKKPRSQAPVKSRWATYWSRLAQGPRTLLLWRLCRWYVQEYPSA